MLAILFFQLCFILRQSIHRLIDEMVPSVREELVPNNVLILLQNKLRIQIYDQQPLFQ